MQHLPQGTVRIVRNLDTWIFKISIIRLVFLSEELYYVSILWFICSSWLLGLYFGCVCCLNVISIFPYVYMVSVIFSKFLLFSLIRYSIVLLIRNPFFAYFYSLVWHDNLIIVTVHQLQRAWGTLKLSFFYPYEGELYQNL
jgi:hypothetical protein